LLLLVLLDQLLLLLHDELLVLGMN
jgi:hypothetical protein